MEVYQLKALGMIQAIAVLAGFVFLLHFVWQQDGESRGLRVKYGVGGVLAWLWLVSIDVADFFDIVNWHGPIRYVPFRTLSVIGVWYAVWFYRFRKVPKRKGGEA
jgi:homogentisate 1,2-dioxygenase